MGNGGTRIMEPEVSAQAVADFDPEIFVKATIANFENQTGSMVTRSAESLIIDPAIQHRDRIMEEVHAHNVTEDVIADAVVTLLRNAVRFAQEEGSDVVEDRHVKRAMLFECRWFPWC
jgi:hypothetical protein